MELYPILYGRLYLPIFLLRVGLLTLIKMDTFMVLARLWPSLPTMWKPSTDVQGFWPLLQYIPNEVNTGHRTSTKNHHVSIPHHKT